MLHVFLQFIICRLHKLTVTEQTQVILQVRVSVSDLVSRFLARPPFAGLQNFFYNNRNPFLASLPTGKF